MKKRLTASILAGTMAFSLAACGGSGSTADTTATHETTAAAATAAPAESTDAANTPDASDAAADLGQAPELKETSWSPSTTVSIVVPAGAGGGTDLSARMFAQYAKELTGADFIVVNANGAAGSVAANQVLSAAADGHTFLYGHALVNVANIAGVTDYNYTAFTLGPTFSKSPAQQLYVNPDKYQDLDGFIEAAKAAPGQLKVCTEVGAYTYYEILAFEKAAGIDLDLVDVGSNADKIAAMLSGQVDLMPGDYVNCKDYLDSGQFACIGAPLAERSQVIPDIPTLKEQGVDLVYPDLDYSFYFPEGTPEEVIIWYENLVQQVLADPVALEALQGVELAPYYLSAQDSAKNEETIYSTIKGIADELAN